MTLAVFKAARHLAASLVVLGPGCEVVADLRVDAPVDPRVTASASIQFRRAARPAASTPAAPPAGPSGGIAP